MMVGIGEKLSATQKKQHQVLWKKPLESLSNKGSEMKQIKRITDIFKDGFMISSGCTMAL